MMNCFKRLDSSRNEENSDFSDIAQVVETNTDLQDSSRKDS